MYQRQTSEVSEICRVGERHLHLQRLKGKGRTQKGWQGSDRLTTAICARLFVLGGTALKRPLWLTRLLITIAYRATGRQGAVALRQLPLLLSELAGPD